ncbi:MAG: helix-turn-helix domain-containing protein [Pseudomonadales bacterium]|nr:helix-turn-helix domain-containing protein [Pseudomonadales bacterium]
MKKANRYNVDEKLAILREVEVAGNIQATCTKYGVSRDSFYRWQRAFSEEGLVGLENKAALSADLPE